jgi:hypothetical protein
MTADQIIIAMLWLTAATPLTRVHKDPEYASEIAAAVVEAEQAQGIPAELLVSVMYHESSFDSAAIGKIGEVGLGQVHGLAARGCDLTTARGQVQCSAAWLARWRFECSGSDWHNPLVGYASGACRTDSERLHRKIRMRESMARRIKRYVDGHDGRTIRIATQGGHARARDQI